MTIHCQKDTKPKHSQSPVLIRHHVPLQFSLKIINSLNMKMNHRAKEDYRLRKIIHQSAGKHPQHSKETVFIFKNQSQAKFVSQLNISHQKLSKVFKNHMKSNQEHNNTESLIFQHINERIMTQSKVVKQSPMFMKQNSLNDLSSKTQSMFIDQKYMINDEKKQNRNKQPNHKTKIKTDDKLRRRNLTQNSIRKNSMVYNFKRDLTSSRSARTIKQNAHDIQTFQTKESLNPKTILKGRTIKSEGKPQNEGPQSFSVSGRKVPDFEIKVFAQTLIKR